MEPDREQIEVAIGVLARVRNITSDSLGAIYEAMKGEGQLYCISDEWVEKINSILTLHQIRTGVKLECPKVGE